MPRFLPHAASQFDHCDARREQARDIARMPPQQPLVRAREAVFGEMRNGLEQRTSQLVVKILRVELLLRLREAAAHVRRKFADGCVILAFNLRPTESLRRHKDS